MPTAREGYVPLENATLFYREIGEGQPIILLHGGPDFDHTYLLPDMDRLADSYRLIYYDQRGRGKSAPETQPESVTIQSEMEDLEALCQYLQLNKVAVLGHSWGGLLALEYATRHPDSLSHLILLNTAAVSHQDFQVLRQGVRAKRAPYQNEMDTIAATAAYKEGDPDAVTNYYRLHFTAAFRYTENLNKLMKQMRPSFIQQVVLRSRAIEDHLYEQTWLVEDYDLFPALQQLDIPTLVIHGDHDFIPAAIASHVAETIPGATFTLLQNCGHFSYIESPDGVRSALATFFQA
jgi:proline iminopeptidase